MVEDEVAIGKGVGAGLVVKSFDCGDADVAPDPTVFTLNPPSTPLPSLHILHHGRLNRQPSSDPFPTTPPLRLLQPPRHG